MARFDFGPETRGDEPASTLTVRELFAGLAMANFVETKLPPETYAVQAVKYADALLKELGEDSGGES